MRRKATRFKRECEDAEARDGRRAMRETPFPLAWLIWLGELLRTWSRREAFRAWLHHRRMMKAVHRKAVQDARRWR